MKLSQYSYDILKLIITLKMGHLRCSSHDDRVREDST